MNPKIYQVRAAETIRGGEPQDQLHNFFFGAFGEAGEITDLLKKVFWHHHDLDLEMLSKELGDAFWYTAALCTVWGLEFQEVHRLAVAKYALYRDLIHMKQKDVVIWATLQLSKSLYGLARPIEEGDYSASREALADFLAPLLVICLAFGLNFNDILDQNITKLEARYGGKFDPEKSRNRES